MMFWNVKGVVTLVFGMVLFVYVVLLHVCSELLFLESGFTGLWGICRIGAMLVHRWGYCRVAWGMPRPVDTALKPV